MSLLLIEHCKMWLKKSWPLCDFDSEVEQDRLKTLWEIYPGMITSSGLKWMSSALNALSNYICQNTIGKSVGLHGTLAAMNSISICKLGKAFSINFTGSKLPTGRPDFNVLRVRPPSSCNVLAAWPGSHSELMSLALPFGPLVARSNAFRKSSARVTSCTGILFVHIGVGLHGVLDSSKSLL